MCAQESEARQGANSSAQWQKGAPQLLSSPAAHGWGHTPVVVKCPRTNGNAPTGSVWLGMCPWVTAHTPLSLLSPVAWRSASGPAPLSALPAHLVTFSFRVVGRTTCLASLSVISLRAGLLASEATQIPAWHTVWAG